METSKIIKWNILILLSKNKGTDASRESTILERILERIPIVLAFFGPKSDGSFFYFFDILKHGD